MLHLPHVKKGKNIYKCTWNGCVSAKNIYYPAGIQTDWNLKKKKERILYYLNFPAKKS